MDPKLNTNQPVTPTEAQTFDWVGFEYGEEVRRVCEEVLGRKRLDDAKAVLGSDIVAEALDMVYADFIEDRRIAAHTPFSSDCID